VRKSKLAAIIIAFVTIITSDICSQLPPITICQDDNDAIVGLDRKAWTSNVDDVSESYQLDFIIPDNPPYECVSIDRVTFTINGFMDDNNIPPDCFSSNWTHVLNCSSNAPISCDTDPFDCCTVDASGLNNYIIDNDDDDLFEGQTLGFDIVAVINGGSCDKMAISNGSYSASFEVCMEVFYIADISEEELELEEDPTVCEGQFYSLEAPSGFDAYEWQGAIDSDERVIDNAIPGNYALTVTDGNGCTLVDEIEIIADAGFTVNFNQADPYIICNQSNEQIQALVNNSIQSGDYTYTWTTPAGNNPTTSGISVDTSGTYNVVVTDEDSGCMVTETIEVIITQLSVAQIDSLSSNIITSCESSVSVEAFTPSTDNTPYTYQWINGTDTVRTQNLEISETGTYILNLLNDLGCPSTSDTIEVNFTPPSIAGQDNQVQECNNQIFDLNIYLSGDAEQGGTWENISGRGSLIGSEFDPMAEVGVFNFNYIIVNSPPCINDTSEITLVINESYNTVINDALCQDDFREINGVIYNQNNPTGQEDLFSISGCDSTLIIDFTFVTESRFLLDSELCADDFRTINGIIYDINNPTGEETITSANGCDSIITIDLSFVTEINTDLIEELCTDDFRVVNSIRYDITNPTGTETLLSTNGCDSIVRVDLTFIDEINFTLDPELCPDESVIVSGTIYDISNPTGTETLQSISGCDSIVTVDLNFSAPINMLLDLVLCPGDFIEINGNIYDVSNSSGTEVFSGSNRCDSTVVIDINYFPENPETSQTLLFCDSIFVIDEWIFQAGPVVDILSDINGCDSIINTLVELDNCDQSIRATFIDLDCFGDDDGTITVEVIGDYDYPLDYTISLNSNIITESQLIQEGNIDFNMLSAGTYTIELIDSNSNSIYSESVNINSPDELQVILTEEVSIDCNGNTNGQISSMIIGGTIGTVDYLWSDMTNGSELTGIGAGMYAVTVEDSNSCTAEDRITLDEPEVLTATILGSNIVCNSSDGGSIQLSDINGGTPPYVTSIDGINYEDITVYDNLIASDYMVSVRDDNNCIYEDIITIISESTFTITQLDTIRIEEGNSATIDLNLGFTPTTISWSPVTDLSCDDCEITEASPASDVSYTVTVTDDMGCENITEVYVKVTPMIVIAEPIEIYFPNTFSNDINDGIDNVFRPLTNSNLELSITSIIIYDRWGNIIHEEIGQVDGWNGFVNNTPAEIGVYLYKMNYTIDGKENIAVGNVTLIR